MAQVSIERRENRFLQDLLTTSDRMLLTSTRDFVEERVMPVRRELVESTWADYRLVEETLAGMLPLGLQGGFLPEEYGGMGLSSALTMALLAEEMGRGDASLFAAMMEGMMAMRPAINAGNRAVLEHFAPRFVQEKETFLGCFSLTEPQGEGDIENPDLEGAGITCEARQKNGGWVLDGAKTWAVNAGLAGAYCVAASTDPRAGEEGIALLYLEAPAPGFTFLGLQEKSGLRGARQGGFELTGLRVPAEWRAAGPGRDSALLRDNLAFARIVSAGLAMGVAQAALDEVLAFTADRVAAGKPIRQHTVCAALLADVAIAIQAGRDHYVNAAYAYDRPETYGEGASAHMFSRASSAKVFCCDAAISATNRIMELMGSYAYVTDYHVEKYWRDAKTLQLWNGGALGTRLDVVRGYYDFDQFHRSELYEHIRGRS